MFAKAKEYLREQLDGIREAGLYKNERVITGPQSAHIGVAASATTPAGDVLNMCANNYLGLSSHPKVIAAAKHAIDTHGYGLSSVRFSLSQRKARSVMISVV